MTRAPNSAAALPPSAPNAWKIQLPSRIEGPSIFLEIAPSLLTGVTDNDAVVLTDIDNRTVFARIYRVRRHVGAVTLLFDALVHADAANLPDPRFDKNAPPSRLEWSAFEQALKAGTGKTWEEILPLEGKAPKEQAYLRRLLQLAVQDDLYGPANGAEEEVVGGVICSPWWPGLEERYPRRWHIQLPGELFLVTLSPPGRWSKGKATASLSVVQPWDDCATVTVWNDVRQVRESACGFDWSRPAASIAADIRRRCVNAYRPQAIKDHAAGIARIRDIGRRQLFMEDLGRLLGSPLDERNSQRITAPGFSTCSYSLDQAAAGHLFRCEIHVSLEAFRLIASIIRACHPTRG